MRHPPATRRRNTRYQTPIRRLRLLPAPAPAVSRADDPVAFAVDLALRGRSDQVVRASQLAGLWGVAGSTDGRAPRALVRGDGILAQGIKARAAADAAAATAVDRAFRADHAPYVTVLRADRLIPPERRAPRLRRHNHQGRQDHPPSSGHMWSILPVCQP